ARDVLSHGGHVPTNSEVLMACVEALLEKRDPIRKAQRAAARKQAKESSSHGKKKQGDTACENTADRNGSVVMQENADAVKSATAVAVRQQTSNSEPMIEQLPTPE